MRPDPVAVEAEADAAGERHEAQEVGGHEREAEHVVERPVRPRVDDRGGGAESAQGDEPRQLGGPRAPAR